MDIAAWLHRLGLEQYEQAFHDNDVDAEVLPESLRRFETVRRIAVSCGRLNSSPTENMRKTTPYSARSRLVNLSSG